MAETKARHIANLVEDDGDVKSAHLDNITVTPTAVSDQANTSTGYLDVPAGTTAQRPTLNNAGGTRFNTTTGSLEFYDGNNWVPTNLIPSINSITGTIYNGLIGRTLTVSITNATDTVDIKYFEGSTLIATDSGKTVTNGSTTSTIPSAVYGQTIGDTISIQVVNDDGTPSSNSIDKTVTGLPTGSSPTTNGHTFSTTGNYRVHTFTASGTFTNYINNLSVEYLVIAGGGGGGVNSAGGGGAGGYRCSVSGESSGGGASAESALTMAGSSSGNNYTVTVGGGGAGGSASQQGYQDPGTSGDISVFSTITSNGGGGGAASSASQSGGSGGGAAGVNATGGAGTSGQGFDGGDAPNGGASGGGAGAIGGDGHASFPLSGTILDGGDGVQSSINGTPTTRAGGGGGSGDYRGTSAGGGGAGGGGAGSATQGANGGSGGTNTGSGGGGSSYGNPQGDGGAGGSGIVIVRYQLPA